MSSAREIIAEVCCAPHANKLDTADRILRRLHEAGFHLVPPGKLDPRQAVHKPECEYSHSPLWICDCPADAVRTLTGGNNGR